MTSPRILRRLGIWLAAVALVCSGVAAIAQAEPSLNQVYEAAQAGRLADAQVMMQQVLVAHPDSAKAHFVDAEVAARAGKLQRARESLARAEKLAPGLPFAKPEAVASLRAELAGARSVTPRGASGLTSPSVQQPRTDATAPASASSFPLGLGLALGGGAIALVLLLLRRKSTPPPMAPNSYGDRGPLNGGLTGPQAFGGGGGVAAPMGYGQPGYGQPGYGQAPGTGMGSRVMGGLATGMAVGAGVLAAEAIGRNLMGSDEHRHAADSANTAANNDYLPLADTNADMGGQNFGVNDAGSWDDGGALSGGDVGGGGDWDS